MQGQCPRKDERLIGKCKRGSCNERAYNLRHGVETGTSGGELRSVVCLPEAIEGAGSKGSVHCWFEKLSHSPLANVKPCYELPLQSPYQSSSLLLKLP